MRAWRSKLVVVVSVLTVGLIGLPAAARADGPPGQIASLLGLPDQGQPVTATDPGALSNLKSADPGSHISLIDPPTSNSQGSAQVSYPIDVPAGRNNSQPNLSISYDSTNGDGWLGLGWDLSTQAIAVDTRWGAPHYEPTTESESYDFDGNELTPLAHRSALLPREAERTFQQRIEGTFYTITRHGGSPTDYWWEVVDQDATHYYFGAKLAYENGELTASLDRSQVLGSAKGIYKWPLTAVADFSNNVTTYHYTMVHDPVSSLAGMTGWQLYLNEVDYDIYNNGKSLGPAPYTVKFDLTRYVTGTTPRPDVLSDARGGFLQVTGQLLHSITVAYQGKTVRSYQLAYRQGEFDKSLLQSITEYGADGGEFNTHSFTYYDNVKGANGSYDGFSGSSSWDTGSGDGVTNSAISGLEDPSALSGAYSNSYDGHIYLGFNPLEPSKDGSVGVTVDYNHVDSSNTLAMVDINGDGLPDKVFESGGKVWYRLNRSGPEGSTVFGSAQLVGNLDTLAQESSDSVSVGPEAHIGVSVLYSHSWTFTNSSVYFLDVNNDGLPDLVHNGRVLFDHLADGVPTFTPDSSQTLVPIGSSQVDATALLPELKTIYQKELAASPLVDAVRRWVAPYSGTIAITGSVSMADPAPASYTSADGVTAAIQHNDTQLWSEHLDARDTSAQTPPSAAVGSIKVQAGDRIYFRTESGYDGKYDQVSWDPTISYVGAADATDANGLPTDVFDATKDFTVAGRQNMQVTMPFDGTVAMSGQLTKSAATSDDVTVQVLETGTGTKDQNPPTVLFHQTLLAAQTGTITPPTSLSVSKGERLELRVAIGSRVDLSKIQWDPSLYYTAGTDPHGAPLQVKDSSGHFLITLNPPYSTDVYPRSTVAAPDTGAAVAKGEHSVVPGTPATIPATPGLTPSSPTPLAGHPTGDIVFTVKTTNRLLAKETLSVHNGLVAGCTVEDVSTGATSECSSISPTGWASLSFSLAADAPVFYDFSILQPGLADDIPAGNADGQVVPVHGTYNPSNSAQDSITGKGLYAQPYRGWATASYNGGDRSDGTAMDESKLVIDTSNYPDPDHYYHPDLGSDAQNPNNPDAHPYPTSDQYDPGTGFTDAAGAADPTKASAWTLSPSPAHTDKLQDPPVPVPDQWQGSKDEVWVRAGTMASARLAQDYVSVPSAASFAGAGAVSQVSQTQQDAIEGDLLGLGGSYSWGNSDGLVDELDMNGDGFPDIVGDGSIQYTNTVGSLDPAATKEPGLRTAGVSGDSGSARESHSSAWELGLSGNAAKFSADSKGSTNAPEQTQPEAGTAKKPSSAGSGALEEAPAGTGKSNALATRPASSGGAVSSSEAASEQGAAAGSAASSAISKRGTGAAGAEADGAPPETASDGGGKLALGVSGKYSQGDSNQTSDHALGGGSPQLVNTDLTDINGDGLPDRVSSYTDGTMKVALNLGYTFAAPVVWSDNAITQKGSSVSVNGGVNIGFNDGMFGIGGGITGGTEADQDDGVLLDINGDGLADYLTDRDGQLYAAINTGDGFAPPALWQGAMTSSPLQGVDSQIATSTSANLGGGAYFTVGIPTCAIPPDFEPACYIIINPGFDYSRSMSRQELELRDINGDGYPDDMSSTSDSSAEVALNNTGETNLLKTVARPLGGSFSIDYQRNGNTTADPYSTWTMSKVTVHDHTPTPSADTQVTTYSYAGNVYDREEREVYGFATVTETQTDPATGKPYRTIVQTYANDNYYDHGLLTGQTVEDGSGAQQTSTQNTYTLHDVATGQDLTDVQARQNGLDSVFPELSSTTQQYFWGKATAGKTTTVTYQYGPHGNPTRIIDSGDGPANAVTAAITYEDCASTNIFDVPTSVTISGANGVLRHQTATVPCDLGAPTDISQDLGDGVSATTTITYDDKHYNIASITYPPNLNKQAYTVNYDYDQATSTYVSKTTDSFGYTSKATYDPMFGTVASQTDANGNTTTYAYDQFGRLGAVVGPDQQGTGKNTLTFDYHIDNGVPWPWAETHAIDALHGGTVDSVRFVDGLDRTVQTKHDATVSTGPTTAPEQVMVVSGRVVFDFLGRVREQYYPTTEPPGTPSVLNTGVDSQAPATSSYDVLDRLTSYIAPSKTTTAWTYDFGPDKSGTTQFRTTRIDALGNKTATYTDIRQQVTAVDQYDGSQQVWTGYDYNPLNQLTSITDDQGNKTSIGYDEMGRETSIDSPDSGRTTMSYDLASNLVSKQTANMRAEKKSPSINYGYDYTHLISIGYPDDPGTDVTYTYGAPGAAHNTAGRVAKVVDQAGTQAYQYGPLGQVTQEASTIDGIRAQPTATYTTDFSYDTWGRLHTLSYPDGEKLTYDYGFGGLADGISGVESGGSTDQYVKDLQYDKFGHQVLQVDGNGTTTQYGYSPTSQLLEQIRTDGPGGVFQNQSYAYDKVGNVVSEKNSVPVPSADQYGGPSSQSFTYDPLYRLTGASGTYDYAPDDTRSYQLALTYDSLGDVLTNTQTDTITEPGGASQQQAPTTHDWTYHYAGGQPNAVQQITGTGTLPGPSNGKGSGHSPSSGVTYAYDADGNQTGWKNDSSGERRTIVWDDANRIQSIANNGQTTRFRYDAKGRRVVSYGPGGVTTAVNPYYSVINGTQTVKTIFLGSQRVAQQNDTPDSTDGTKTYFYHRDLNGSTAYVTDGQGAVFQHLEYFPGGAPWVDEVSDPHVIGYLYTSHPYSSVTQLSYYGARYYDPQLGQFISPDPGMQPSPQAAIADPMLLQPYSYADNNPMSYIDPNGMAPSSAQQEYLHQTFATPEQRQAFLAASDQIIKSYLSQQPTLVKLAASGPSRKSMLTAYKKLAALEAPPLIAVKLSKGRVKVKIAGIKVPTGRNR